MQEKLSLNSISVKIAGVVVKILTEYRPAVSLYQDFRTSEQPECCIMLNNDDIDFSAVELNLKNKLLIKTNCIIRKFSEALLSFEAILMHGAVVGLGNAAYLFTAPSHTGKTTHARLWIDNCPDAYFVNGDKPFIRFTEDGSILACGSPWAGKENLYTNTMTPLKSIVLMERAENNCIRQISFAEAFPTLFQQTYHPSDEDKMRKTLRLLQRLDPSVSFWRFGCNNFKDDCFKTAYNALVRDQK